MVRIKKSKHTVKTFFLNFYNLSKTEFCSMVYVLLAIFDGEKQFVKKSNTFFFFYNLRIYFKRIPKLKFAHF